MPDRIFPNQFQTFRGKFFFTIWDQFIIASVIDKFGHKIYQILDYLSSICLKVVTVFKSHHNLMEILPRVLVFQKQIYSFWGKDQDFQYLNV